MAYYPMSKKEILEYQKCENFGFILCYLLDVGKNENNDSHLEMRESLLFIILIIAA